MSVLHVLGSIRRPSRLMALWVLAWFALSCLAAIAAPVMQPQGATLVCTAAGEVKWVDADASPDADAGMVAGHHTLDCVLCLPLIAPPPSTPAFSPLPHAARNVLAADFAPFFPRTGYSKLAARGPPHAS